MDAWTASNGVTIFPDERLPQFLVVQDVSPPNWRKTRKVLNHREIAALRELFAPPKDDYPEDYLDNMMNGKGE